jgi:ferredoxin
LSDRCNYCKRSGSDPNMAERIHCSACVKKCPTGARKWESAWIDKTRKWIAENYRQRKEPEIYL